MKRFIPFSVFFVLVLAFNSCNYITGIDGNGEVAEENRVINAFENVDISGKLEVVFIPSREPYVKVIADENLLELIKTEVDGDLLRIYSEQNIGKYEKLLVEVGFNELKAIESSGAVKVSSQGTIRTKSLKIDCSGAADIVLDVKVKELSIELSGAGDIEISGKTEDLEMDISGAAEVSTIDLIADHVDIEVSGAALCKVHARKSLKVDASGAADVQYAGKPDKVKIDNSGASDVEAL